MASFNKFMAVGYLSKDAEVRTLPGGGTEVAEFSIYTKEYQGKGKDLKTEFFDCSSFLPSVIEAAKRGLAKGTQVYVDGKMESSEYENKQGVKVRKWRVRVVDLKFLQPKNNGEEGDNNGTANTKSAPRQTTRAAAPQQQQQAQSAPVDDDCPF